ncbi:regulatory solute carrier protein family 1 member 1 isoform X2 [Apodemus sylvaticus]|uniref:regulatory solute carrier protein family 1 member 1 isoform X2 n=1 Tax=Apodemus sylvaticus TaxID=10129 RepID=UPI0022431A82|nr:regulatory solute carrier protein family 1 member 1 isoform X2 [Apodemus sylvaticus]
MQSVRSHDACVCVCRSWSGPRPEKSSKESTSLEMSSLSTSDGFNHPAPSGQSPEVGSPSLARSVSASVCAIKPSDPNSTESLAMEATKASAEFQTNSKKTDPPPLQALPGLVPSAEQSLATPLHNSSEEASVTGNLETSAEKRTQGLRVYLHTRQGASLSLTTTRMHEPQIFVEEKSWHPENQTPSQENGLEQHREAESVQSEAGPQSVPWEQACLCDTQDLGLREQVVSLDAVVKGELHRGTHLPRAEKGCPASGRYRCPCSEALMEVDTADQSLVALCSSAGRQDAVIKSPAVPHLASDNPSMEVEALQSDPSCERVEHSILTRDLQHPEDNVEMSTMDNKDDSSSSPLSGHGQPSMESAEEFCSSVTVALKELHELLVISCKPASEDSPEDITCQSEIVAESQTSVSDLTGRRAHSEHLTPSHHDPQSSCHQAASESEKTEIVEDEASTSFGGLGDGLSPGGEGVPRSTVRKSCSVTITSAKLSEQLPCTSGVQVSPELAAGDEGTCSQPSEHVQNPGPDRLETSSVCPGAGLPFSGLNQPSTQSLSTPSALPPFIFPAADVDRILGAGFTLQEALGALHRVGGNADLALLVLLAKNIVVPT